MRQNSISKLFLGTGIILFAGMLAMCKKDSRTCKIAPEQGHVNMDKDGIIQKSGMVKSPDYHFSDKENYDRVKAFKAQAKKRTAQDGSADDLALDDAQYTLESSINFDFDSYGGSAMLEVHQDVSNYSFNTGDTHPASGFISSDEVIEIYNQLRTRFSQIVSTTVKISAIDVVAYIDDDSGKGHFEVTASVMQVNSAGTPFRCATAVWAPATNYANCSWAEVNGIFSCGLFTYPAGLTGVRSQFQAEMNCRDLIYAGCENGYYFPVVTTVMVSAVPNDTRLYYGPTVANALFYCNATGGTTLTGAVYNSKLANAKSFVLSNCSASGLDLVDNSTVVSAQGYAIPQTAMGVMMWGMSFQKGVRNCRPDPID